jgi:hypothetical protein
MDSALYNVHESKMYLAFEGGFCLLRRLHFLQRLSVDAVCQRVFYEPWELTWMLGPEEQEQEEGRKERRKALAGLEQREPRSTLQSRSNSSLPLATESPNFLSCTSCRTKTGRLRPTISDNKSDNDDEQDVRMALETLGHVQDIVEVMDELEAATGEGGEGGNELVKCWPHLQKIALYRPNRYGLSRREEAIQQLVPDTFFQTLVRKAFY